MALDDVYEVRFFCAAGDQLGINVRHYVVTAQGGAGATPAEMALAISNSFATNIKPLMAADAQYLGVVLRRILPTLGAEATSTAGTGAGTATGSSLPRQATGIITLLTGNPGRSGRGRGYLPFPSSTWDVTGGIPSTSYLTSAGFIGTLWTGPYTVTGILPGDSTTVRGAIFHRATTTVTQVLSYIVRRKWATQKRRGSYGKSNALPF